MTNIFIDSDVILDLLLKRQPWHKEAVKIFTGIEDKKIEGCTSPLILANIHYILSKPLGKTGSIEIIRKLAKLLSITTIDSACISKVLDAPVIKDFEDLVQMNSAIERKCDYLITRNVKDYPNKSDISIFTPLKFLSTMS